MPSPLHPSARNFSKRVTPAPASRRRQNQSPDCGGSVLTRIVKIHIRLGNGRRANAVTLARELEVSSRTIKRDVEFMRHELGAAIAWEPSTQTYFYERPCDLLPLLRLDADEALALVLAGHTFSAWRGSSLGRALTAALGKIAGVIGSAISLPATEVSHLVFQPDDAVEADEETRFFPVALEAIRRRRELRIHYRKPGAEADERRTIHPLHLAFLDHRWVLVAHDPTRRAPRNFLLARIRAAVAGPSFEPPTGFDLPTYLRGSLGRFTGGKEITVQIIFDSTVAPYVRERPWHASQEITDLPDSDKSNNLGGGIKVTLRLNNLIDVQRRVLACGSHAEVLAPAELRDAIRTEAAALVARYQAGPPLTDAPLSPPL